VEEEDGTRRTGRGRPGDPPRHDGRAREALCPGHPRLHRGKPRAGGRAQPPGASSFGKAVVFGPHMFNFREMARLLVAGGGAVQVRDAEDLAAEAGRLLRDEPARGRWAYAERASWRSIGGHGAGLQGHRALFREP